MAWRHHLVGEWVIIKMKPQREFRKRYLVKERRIQCERIEDVLAHFAHEHRGQAARGRSVVRSATSGFVSSASWSVTERMLASQNEDDLIRSRTGTLFTNKAKQP